MKKVILVIVFVMIAIVMSSCDGSEKPAQQVEKDPRKETIIVENQIEENLIEEKYY